MLDKTSPIPLYHQLRTVLEDKIAAGEWKLGTQIPSERELCEQHGVSRLTVRQAVAELVHAGQLIRDHGRGTFVAQPRVEQRLNQLTSFTQDMIARDVLPGSRILDMSIGAPEPAVAQALQLEPGGKVIVLKRLRLANGEPLAIENAYLPHKLCAGLLAESLENVSLYELLAAKYGLTLHVADQRLEAIACPAPEANLLGISRGAPVLHIQRLTFSRDGTPFEYTESIYRGDKHFFRIELRNEYDESHRR